MIGQNNQQKEDMKMRGYRSFRDRNKPLNGLAIKLTAPKEQYGSPNKTFYN